MPLTIEPMLPAPQSRYMRKLVAGALEHVLGIRKMSKLYDQHGLEHTSGERFLEQVIRLFNIQLSGVTDVQQAIPKTGPVVIAANHPFGGLEGVIMLYVISKVRPDVKVLANFGLALFPQMKEWSIFTNPLKANNPKNAPSLRRCKEHVVSGGALLVFPAGRVGYFRKELGRIADHDWNRLVSRLAGTQKVRYCPVYIDGKNSPLFYRLGRVWNRFRLLLLARELTNKHNTPVSLHCANSADVSATLQNHNDHAGSSFCRALSYIHHPAYRSSWDEVSATSLEPLAPQLDNSVILEEARSLPAENRLYEQGNLRAYYAQAEQIPNILYEITRRRELVFRMHNEGSGKPFDGDSFDASYTHLFVIDSTNGEVTGAYRMGLTDILQKDAGQDGLYLSQMFNFSGSFLNQTRPCLEMGRSFLMPAYQKSRLGLFMLWRAIGEFVVRNPRYHVLYGTVSLSKLYDKRSVKLIEKLAITPTDTVSPKTSFGHRLPPDVEEHIANYPLADNYVPHLETWLRIIEPDQKGLPVLLRQYANLGATFHSLGVDASFANTPGLLLSVDLSKAPHRKLRQFLGDNWRHIAS